MKTRILEKTNILGYSKFYPQYKLLWMWLYFKYTSAGERVSFSTLDQARAWLHTPKTEMKIHKSNEE